MGLFSSLAEPTDCWLLVGPDDEATPPSVACVVNRAGTRTEWRRAGFPVLFDAQGHARSVMRGGREWLFVPVAEELAAKLPHPPSRTS